MQSLFTGLSALRATSTWLDRIANNIANQDTPGYAADKTTFADTYTQALSGNATASNVSPRYTPPGYWGGTGIFATTESDFSSMSLQPTQNPLDFAIQGDGFFMVKDQSGQTLLTKAGNFRWDPTADGKTVLRTQTGQDVLDTNGNPIFAGDHPSQFKVSADGTIYGGSQPGQKMALAHVAVPTHDLTSAGDNNFSLTQGATAVIINNGPTGQVNANAPQIQQGMLSMSNVDLTTEMVDMIQAQRTFELNSEAIQMTNKMMQTANSIRG